MILHTELPILSFIFEGIIEYEVEFISAFGALALTRHQVAIKEHYVAIINPEPDHNGPLVPTGATETRLDLSGFNVFNPREEFLFDKEADEAADHGLGNDPHVLFLGVLLALLLTFTYYFNGVS